MPVAEFKELVREQFNILLIDQKAALEAIPSMLPSDPESREKALELIHQVLRARGELSVEDNERLKEIVRLFGVDSGAVKGHLREIGKKPKPKPPENGHGQITRVSAADIPQWFGGLRSGRGPARRLFA